MHKTMIIDINTNFSDLGRTIFLKIRVSLRGSPLVFPAAPLDNYKSITLWESHKYLCSEPSPTPACLINTQSQLFLEILAQSHLPGIHGGRRGWFSHHPAAVFRTLGGCPPSTMSSIPWLGVLGLKKLSTLPITCCGPCHSPPASTLSCAQLSRRAGWKGKGFPSSFCQFVLFI